MKLADIPRPLDPPDTTMTLEEYNRMRIEKAQQSADSRQVGGGHYKDMPIQPWNVMEVLLSREEFIGFLKGNYLKYAMRAGHKGSAEEDAAKALHYKEKLDEILNKQTLNKQTLNT